MPFFDIFASFKVITIAHAHKSGVIFHIFPRAFKQKKIKALLPKITKIASRWSCVERSLPPWAIFLIFTRNRPWKSEDHLSAPCFLLKCQRKNSKKSERTPLARSFVASLGAGVQPWSTVQLFMPVSGVELPPFWQLFLGFGVSFGE